MQGVGLFNLSGERFGVTEPTLKHGILFDLIIFLEICLKEIGLVQRYTHTQTGSS